MLLGAEPWGFIEITTGSAVLRAVIAILIAIKKSRCGGGCVRCFTCQCVSSLALDLGEVQKCT